MAENSEAAGAPRQDALHSQCSSKGMEDSVHTRRLKQLSSDIRKGRLRQLTVEEGRPMSTPLKHRGLLQSVPLKEVSPTFRVVTKKPFTGMLGD